MNIKKYRIEKGLSQRELGELIGMTQQQVAQYENGKRKPKLETVLKFAKALEVKPRQLDYSEYIDDTIDKQPSLRESVEHMTTIKTENKTFLALATSFAKLNDKGQEKAASYVDDLSKIPEYKKE